MAEDVFQILQDNVGGVNQQIQLVNGHELRIQRNGIRKEINYRINSLVLNDKSHWRLRFPWGWLLVAVICIAAALPGSLIELLPRKIYMGTAYFICLLVIGYSLYRIVTRTALVKIFYTLHAHYPLIEIGRDNPNREEFTTFINHLEESIKSYKQQHKLPEDKQLAGEIRTLRRLKNEKIISKNDYESAKEKLFKLF